MLQRLVPFVLLTLLTSSGAIAAPSVHSGPRLITPRAGHDAVRLFDGRILVVGGVDEDARGPGAEVYDPNDNRFHAVVGTEDRFRGEVGVARLRDGRVYIATNRERRTLSWIFDPQTDRMSRVEDLVKRYGYPRAALMGNDRVAVMGEASFVEGYDPRTDRVARIGGSSLDYFFTSHTLTTVRGSDAVVLVGGADSKRMRVQSHGTTQLIGPTGIRKIGKLKKKRHDHAAVPVGFRQLLVVGGKLSRAFRRDRTVAELELLDLNTETWSVVGKLAIPRWGCAAAQRGSVVAIAGGADRKRDLRAIEIYSVRERKLLSSEATQLRSARSFATATMLRNTRVLVAGGERNGKNLSTTELIRWSR